MKDIEVHEFRYSDGINAAIVLPFLNRPIIIHVGLDGAYDVGDIEIEAISGEEEAKSIIKDLEKAAAKSFQED